MKELFGEDIFDKIEIADALCIPTNCSIMEDGSNPMGALAGAFARRWKNIPLIYGNLLKMTPHVPVILGMVPQDYPEDWIDIGCITDDTRLAAIVAFPTMREIGIPASLPLVKRSASLLVELANIHNWKSIYLGAPGCGIGGLDYNVVRLELQTIFDDRFYVMQK